MTAAASSRPAAERQGGWFWSWLGGTTRGASVTRLVISAIVFLAAWELVSEYVVRNRLLLVPFQDAVSAMIKEVQSGSLWVNLGTTLLELVIAFPISVAGGMLIGAILAGSKPVRQTLDPILTGLYSVPIVALAPLFIAGLGLGVSSKVAVIILMAIFPIIMNTDAGLRSAEPSLVEMSQSFGARRIQVLRTVTFPHAVPFLVSGIRVAFSRALVGVIVAEIFGSTAGVGFAIEAASQSYQTGKLLGYVVILGIVGLLASIGLTALEKRIAPWREEAM